MAISFTNFKDRSTGFFNGFLAFVNRAPRPLQSLFYGGFLFLTRALYYLPFGHVRPVAIHFAKHLKGRSPRHVYFSLTKGIVRMIRAFQQMDQWEEGVAAPRFHIAEGEQSLLDTYKGSGAILIIPHATGSLLAVRELAARYDVLMLVKEPKDAGRAARQRAFYAKLGCDTLDARRTDPVTLARTILKALRAGRFVVGTCDRIRSRPPNNVDYHKYSDTVLAELLGQEIGVVGWPARFAHKCSLPILPLMPTYESDGIHLHFGVPIAAVGEITADSQAWVDGLWQLFRQHPEHWMFAYDKKWAKLFRDA